ncbi:MAG TPA: hypothetical protein VKU90_04700 [Caulobacteraceae bacterium]|nr:hypothetical protein [Caulobacteraceae bacterium]
MPNPARRDLRFHWRRLLPRLGGGSRWRALLARAIAACLLAAPLAASAQSLPATLEQIRTTLGMNASVAWEATAHDALPAAGGPTDWTYTRRVELGDVTYDPTRCTLGLHYRVLTNGQVTTDAPEGLIPLAQVTAVRLRGEADLVQERDAKAGRSSITTRLDPAIYDVELARADGHDVIFSFYDEAVARRLAALVEHAVSLCTPPPGAG